MSNLERPNDDLNLGDCEIREILFDHPNVSVVLFDPYYRREAHIKFFDVRYCLLASNHMQNVIGGLHIFPCSKLTARMKKYPFLRYAIAHYPRVDDLRASDVVGF